MRKIRKIVKNNRSLFVNFSYLAILRVFVLVLPLITYPYLIRVLGAEFYGSVVFAQTIISFFSIVINFGFNISATKEISIERNNKKKLSEIVSSVIILKFCLWIGSLIVLLILIFFADFTDDTKLLLMFSFGLCFNELLFPIWFFQGIEEMKYITYVNIFSKSISLMLIFSVINFKSDFIYVPLINSIGAFLGGIVSLYIIFAVKKVKFKTQPFHILKGYFYESLPLFGTRVAAQIYVNTSAVIIGLFLGKIELAYFDLANKIVAVVKIPINILSQTLFPKVSKEKNILFIKKILRYSSLIMICLVAVLIIFAKYPILILGGDKMLPSIEIVRILLLSVIPITFSTFLGTQVLVTFGHSRFLVKSMSVTSIFYLLSLSIYYYFDGINLFNMALLAVSVEAFLSLYQYYGCKKHKLI